MPVAELTRKTLTPARALFKNRDLRARLFAYGQYLLAHPSELVRPRPSLAYQEPPYLRAPIEGRAAFCPPAVPRLAWGTRQATPPTFLPLASVELDASEPAGIDWSRGFADGEDEAALHRFAWLLPWVLKCSHDGTTADSAWSAVLAMVESWVRAHPTPSVGAPWQPYTVSERLVNWTWASLACGQGVPAEASMRDQAAYLRTHLEYYGDQLTGNHLSNNGRALYAAGLTLHHDGIANAGRTILVRERDRLFDADGFLREDSTHYQFLVTRNYCEALWFAKQASDDNMVAALGETVAVLSRACFSFLVRTADGWDLPLLGDISPDCTPAWLLGVPWVGAALTATPSLPSPPVEDGWHTYFGDVVPARPGQSMELPDGGPAWGRAKLGEWTCLAHVNPDGTPRPTSHAHNDTGGIVVYHRGDLVVQDAGRRHYCADSVGYFGRHVWSHSLVVVDGVAPAPEWRWFLAPGFLQQQAGRKPLLSSDERGLFIEYGEGTINPGVGIRRRRLAPREGGSLEIVDDIAGSGIHEVSVIFHLPANTSWSGSDLLIRLPGRQLLLKLAPTLPDRRLWQGPSGEPTFGWAVRRYGAQEAITTVIASGRVSLPWQGISLIVAS